MILRPYRDSDARAAAWLFRRSVHQLAGEHYSLAQRRAWVNLANSSDDWQQRLAPLHSWVVEGDAHHGLAGFIALSDEGVVEYLYVEPEFVRQGVALALYRHLEEHARSLGLTRLSTDASLVAEPFFAQCGFERVAQRADCRGISGLSNARMEKSLQPE